MKGRSKDSVSSFADVIQVMLQQMKMASSEDRQTLLVQVLPMYLEMITSEKHCKVIVNVSNLVLSEIANNVCDVARSDGYAPILSQVLMTVISGKLATDCVENVSRVMVSLAGCSGLSVEVIHALSACFTKYFEVQGARVHFLTDGGFETAWCAYLVDGDCSLSNFVFEQIGTYAEFYMSDKFTKQIFGFLETISLSIIQLTAAKCKWILDLFLRFTKANPKKMMPELLKVSLFNSLMLLVLKTQDENVDVIHYFELFINVTEYAPDEVLSPLNCLLNLFSQPECGNSLRAVALQLLLKLVSSPSKVHAVFEPIQVGQIGSSIPTDDHVSVTLFSTFCFFLQTEAGFPAITMVPFLLKFCTYDLMNALNMTQCLVLFVHLGEDFRSMSTTFFDGIFSHADPEKMAKLFNQYGDLYTIFGMYFNGKLDEMAGYLSTFAASFPYLEDRRKAQSAFDEIMDNKKGSKFVARLLSGVSSKDSMSFQLITNSAMKSTEVAMECITQKCFALGFEKFDRGFVDAKSLLNFLAAISMHRYVHELDTSVYEELKKRDFMDADEQTLLKLCFGLQCDDLVGDRTLCYPSVLSRCTNYKLKSPYDLWLSSQITLELWLDNENKKIHDFPPIIQIARQYIRPTHARMLFDHADIMKAVCSEHFSLVPVFEFPSGNFGTTLDIVNQSEKCRTLTFWLKVQSISPLATNILTFGENKLSLVNGALHLNDKQIHGRVTFDKWYFLAIVFDEVRGGLIYLDTTNVGNFKGKDRTLFIFGGNNDSGSGWYIGGAIRLFLHGLSEKEIKSIELNGEKDCETRGEHLLLSPYTVTPLFEPPKETLTQNFRAVGIYSMVDYLNTVIKGVNPIVERAVKLGRQGKMEESMDLITAICSLHRNRYINIGNNEFSEVMSVYCNMFAQQITTVLVDDIVSGFLKGQDELDWNSLFGFALSYAIFLNPDVSIFLCSKLFEFCVLFPLSDEQRSLLSSFLLSLLMMRDYEVNNSFYELVKSVTTDPKVVATYLVSYSRFADSLTDYSLPYVFEADSNTEFLVSLFTMIKVTTFDDYHILWALPVHCGIVIIQHLMSQNVKLNPTEILDFCFAHCYIQECWKLAIAVANKSNEKVHLENFNFDSFDSACYFGMFKMMVVLTFVSVRLNPADFWNRLCCRLMRKMISLEIPHDLHDSEEFLFWVIALLSLGDKIESVALFPLCPSLTQVSNIIQYAQKRGQVYPESRGHTEYELDRCEVVIKSEDVPDIQVDEFFQLTEAKTIKSDLKVKQLAFIITEGQTTCKYGNWNDFLTDLYTKFGMAEEENPDDSNLIEMIGDFVAQIVFNIPYITESVLMSNKFFPPHRAVNWHQQIMVRLLQMCDLNNDVRIPLIDFACQRMLEGWYSSLYVVVFSSILSMLRKGYPEAKIPKSFYDCALLSVDLVHSEQAGGFGELMAAYVDIVYKSDFEYLVSFLNKLKAAPQMAELLQELMKRIKSDENVKSQWKKKWPDTSPEKIFGSEFEESRKEITRGYDEKVTGRLTKQIERMLEDRESTSFLDQSLVFLRQRNIIWTRAKAVCACLRYSVRRSVIARAEYMIRKCEVRASYMFPFDSANSKGKSVTLLNGPVMPARRLIASPLEYVAPDFPAGTSDEVFNYFSTEQSLSYVNLPEPLLNCIFSFCNRVPYILERSSLCLRAVFASSLCGLWPANEYSMFRLIMNDGKKWKFEGNCSFLYGCDVMGGCLFLNDNEIIFLEGGNVKDSALFFVHSGGNPISNRFYMQTMESGLFGQCVTYKAHFVMVWPFDELIACTEHRWLQKRTALNLNFALGYNFILNFEQKDFLAISNILKRKVHDFFVTAPPQTYALSPVNVSRLLLKKLKGITSMWSDGLLSNFLYLSIVNRYAERSFADLTQYPVFPWVLSDYVSSELPANPTQESYRDLSKPMGQLGVERAKRFQNIYEESDPHYYYGTHYMHFGVVLHFLFRLDPFSIFFFILHRGYDHPNRMFLKMKETWNSAAIASAADVKELIPQMYKVPELFVNHANLPITCNQDGEDLNQVVLPAWAVNARHFIAKELEFLESVPCREKINQWIDLIFGVNSRGSGAEKAKNVFHPTCYPESAKDRDELDEIEKNAIADCVINFGQCSPQIFSKPHVSGDSKPHFVHLLSDIENLVWQRLSQTAFTFPATCVTFTEKNITTCGKDSVLLPTGSKVSLSPLITSANVSSDGLFLIEASTTGFVDISMVIYDSKGGWRSSKPIAHFVTPMDIGKCIISPEHFIAFVIHEKSILQFDLGTKTQLPSINLEFEPEHIAVDDQAALLWICSGRRLCQCSISGEVLINSETEYIMTSLCATNLPEHVKNRFIMTGTSDGTVIFWGYNPVDMTLEVIHRVKLSNEPISVVAVDLTCTRGLAMSGTQVFGFEFIGSECKALHTKYASECVNCRASTSKMSATCKSCQRFLCAKCAKRESGLVCKVCQERRVSPE